MNPDETNMKTFEEVLSEQELVQRILSGEKELYAEIVKRYQGHVLNLCYKLAGEKLDVEEVSQQVFVELYTSLPRFRFESKLSTYIYRITMNVVNKNLNRNSRFMGYDDKVHNSDEMVPSQEQQIEKAEQEQKLHKALGKLKNEQRTALVLFAFDELSYNEIAEVMGASLSKVESLIFRAKKNLKELMTEKS